MDPDTKLVLVGCGNMGYAMLAGWCGSGRIDANEIVVVEPVNALRQRAEELGVTALSAFEDIPQEAKPSLIVFAVKPQMMAVVVPAYQQFVDAGATVVSIAAGTRIAFFEKVFGPGTPVIRCMPNTPAAIGAGMMVTTTNTNVSPETSRFVDNLLSASGEVASVEDENMMDAVTAVSGSGPAYVFHFIESLTSAGIDAGLPPDTAAKLAGQTVLGAAMLAAQSTETPSTLRERVTSPNGTTAAALSVLMGNDRMKKMVSEAVNAARRRSIELG